MLDGVLGLVKDQAEIHCLCSEPEIAELVGLQEGFGCQRPGGLRREKAVHARAVR
jgi:hypothetical protein